MTTADQLIANLEGIDAASFANKAERIRARDAVFEALRRIQSPWDIAWDHSWVNSATIACIKTLFDAGVFAKWAEAGGGTITCSKLADLTGTDVLLIKRMMRALAGQCLVTEVTQDTYERTPWATTLTEDPSFPALYGDIYRKLLSPVFNTLPSFLKERHYRNPTDGNDGNFQFWHGQPADLWKYLEANPFLASQFNDAMECLSKYNLTSWVDIYPTDTIIAAAKARPAHARPLVVDLGGGKGQDLKKFLARHPKDVPAGSLVLQDLPEALVSVKKELASEEAITVQGHDFFTPQPASTKGARVYTMHHILHDWPDEQARQILQALVPAMEKGYSKLLIHESVVSREKPLARVTSMDITMMAFFAAAERTEEHWSDLIESVGLKVVKIWRPAQAMESIIEAEVA